MPLARFAFILYFRMAVDKAALHTMLQFFKINNHIIQHLLMLEIPFTWDSKIEYLFCGAPSSSEPSVFFSDYFFRLGFNPFQDDFIRMTYEVDGSVVLAERYLPFLECVIISD